MHAKRRPAHHLGPHVQLGQVGNRYGGGNRQVVVAYMSHPPNVCPGQWGNVLGTGLQNTGGG